MKALILHCADLHLGGPVAAPTSAVANLAASARENSLNEMVARAKAAGVCLVLLAGDVFHSPTPPLTALWALERACAEWVRGGARVFIAPGNHDPINPDSVWSSWTPLPGVRVLGPEPSGESLPDLGLWVAGAGHRHAHEERDLAAQLPPPPEGLTGVAVQHCDLPSSRQADAHKPYAPTRLEVLETGPFSLWCLGHWHAPRELAASPRILMAGTPQGAHWDESGLRGAWLIEVDGPVARPRFLPLAPLTFADLKMHDLQETSSPAELARKVEERLFREGLAGAPGLCMRLELTGPCPLSARLAGEDKEEFAAQLEKSLGAAGLVLNTENMRPAVEPAVLAGEPHVLGALLELIHRARGDQRLAQELWQAIRPALHPLLAQNLAAGGLTDLWDEVESLALRGLWTGGER